MSKVQITQARGRADKLERFGALFSSQLSGEVLDVGCDTRALSAYTRGHYVGVDIGGQPDMQVNVEEGLPFRDQSFDTVAAFDVLEHLDRIHSAFDELCRVSRSHVIIGLPNMAEWRFRFLYLMGRRIGGKYGLPAEPPVDRHRWLFNLADARTFVHDRGALRDFHVREEVLGYYVYKQPLARLITALGRGLAPSGASLFAYHYCALLTRNGQ